VGAEKLRLAKILQVGVLLERTLAVHRVVSNFWALLQYMCSGGLQDHYCLVRGGADNGQKLMDALLVSSSCCTLAVFFRACGLTPS
jgi:hypothetical protein